MRINMKIHHIEVEPWGIPEDKRKHTQISFSGNDSEEFLAGDLTVSYLSSLNEPANYFKLDKIYAIIIEELKDA